MTVQDIYEAIDAFAPFATQPKWDNSGLLIGEGRQPVNRVLLALDCSPAVIAEAVQTGCDLIVAHHPVIFEPLTALQPSHAACQLLLHRIAAICVHMPLDQCAQGVGDTLWQTLRTPLGLGQRQTSLEEACGGIYPLENPMPAETVALAAKAALGCAVVRYMDAGRPIHSLALGAGACSSMLETAIAYGCDGFLTGDIKHDRWYTAESFGVSLFDCGHFHTEVVVLPMLYQKLHAALPDLELQIAAANRDPVRYVL